MESRSEVLFRGRCLGQLWFFSIMAAWGMYLELYTYFAEYKVLRADDDDNAVALTTYFSMIYSASQFLGSPIMGWLSDTKLGRKKILLTGIIVNTLGFPTMAAFPRVRIYLLLAVAMGFLDATTAVVKATVTDFGDGDTEGIAGSSRDHILARFCYFLIGKGTSTSSATRLTTELAVLHAHSGLGMISGLFLGELLYQFAGLRLAIACAGLILLPVLFAVIFKFPQPSEFDSFGIDNDSQGKANLITTSYQHKDRVEEAMTMKTNTSAFFWQPALPNKRKFPFCLIVFAYVLVMFGIGGLSSVILYYAEDRAGLGSIDIALLILEAVLVTPLTAFLALRIIMPSLGLTRTNAFLTAASAAGSICVGLVPRHSIVLLIIFLTLFFVGYATFPLANGHLASQIPISSQGRFQGQLYALTVAFTLSGQELALKLYDYEPRAPFISTAIAGFTSSILFIIAGEIVTSNTHDSDDDLYEGEEDEEQQHRKLLSDTSKPYSRRPPEPDHIEK